MHAGGLDHRGEHGHFGLHAVCQGVGVAAPAGHQRPAHPARALGLALVGWLGPEELWEGSLGVAEGRERPREMALFCLSLPCACASRWAWCWA